MEIIYGSGYEINLGGGLKWTLLSTKQTKIWVDKFARIMGLNFSNQSGNPWILFIEREELAIMLAENKLSDNLPIPLESGEIQNLPSSKIHFYKSSKNVICEIETGLESEEFVRGLLQGMYPLFRYTLDAGGFPVHAGLIVHKGNGLLLAGSSNTGKSTCCKRLPYNWEALSDDEALIVPDSEHYYRVHPLPTWSEYLQDKHSTKTWEVKKSAVLKAVFFLEQAEKDKVMPIGKGRTSVYLSQIAIQSYRRIWGESLYTDEKARKSKVFDNACNIADIVPAFKLRVSLTGSFWKEIEKVI